MTLILGFVTCATMGAKHFNSFTVSIAQRGGEITMRVRLAADDAWVRERLTARWGTTVVACVSGLHDAVTLDGLIAEIDGRPVGLLTYRIEGDECEAVTIDAYEAGRGIGTALLRAVAELAHERGCRRTWLTTTNDNTPALRFYQRQGWDLVRLHHGIVDGWRRTVKPGIPKHGLDGIPISHALELELRRGGG
jgi:ribosomal protein S18 acetylase RimI-like enzyme